MDVTHVDCGRDSWGHLVAVIDCYDREIVGWEFALRGRAKEAERALEAACRDAPRGWFNTRDSLGERSGFPEPIVSAKPAASTACARSTAPVTRRNRTA